MKYAVPPPIGGPHNPVLMDAGVYTKPVPPKRAVHHLEHGAVWITYDHDLPLREVKQLVGFVKKQTMIPETAETTSPGQENRYMDLTPWSSNDLPAPSVSSSWGYQRRLQSPNDPLMQHFVGTFRHNPKYTPEYGARVDGVLIETGGRPAGSGRKNPFPSGSPE